MRFSLPGTLFAQTATLLSLAFVALLLSGALIFKHFVLDPTAKQASEDAAALLVLSAQTWAELPPQTRIDFEAELAYSHGIELTEAQHQLPPLVISQTHLNLLQNALERRTGQDIAVGSAVDRPTQFVADLPIAGRTLRLAFARDRITPEIPSAVFWLTFAAALLALITTLLLVRHLINPLRKLSHAAVQFGRGKKHIMLKESGPQELAALTRHFNQMTEQVDELIANRTTLLAGISHDLRTPIARLSLALEMLPPEPDLIDRMRLDLKEMDQLITRTLQLAKSFEDSSTPLDDIDLPELLDGIITEYQHQISHLVWQPKQHCPLTVNALALRRVVANLIENAIRYGGDTLELRYIIQPNATLIEVLDSGSGIPEDKLSRVFQPFYRLESSRNVETGGSGLGLAIVQQLAQAQGWQVELNNRIQGGLCARLQIPH